MFLISYRGSVSIDLPEERGTRGAQRSTGTVEGLLSRAAMRDERAAPMQQCNRVQGCRAFRRGFYHFPAHVRRNEHSWQHENAQPANLFSRCFRYFSFLFFPSSVRPFHYPGKPPPILGSRQPPFWAPFCEKIEPQAFTRSVISSFRRESLYYGRRVQNRIHKVFMAVTR